MKIVFTGGGTGGHFYPIIAVAQKVNQIIAHEHIIGAKLYYFSDGPYDKEMLVENQLLYEEIKSGKMRAYFSFQNFFDIFKIFFGTINAIFKMFSIYPDVVFGKGGYASFPTIFAARILHIPVLIHESDSVPGRVNLWAGRFAKKVAVSFAETTVYFPKKNVAWVGQPIRTEIEYASPRQEALKYFKLQEEIPVIVILGGSQGAELINNIVLDSLPILIKNYQIIHQTGIKNFKTVSQQADVILTENKDRVRYLPFSFLNSLQIKMAAGAATIIVSRAGASALFEIASWNVPSIIIPITKSNGNHQRNNAFSYARAGTCSVVEEANMTANILMSEIDKIIENKVDHRKMMQNTKDFNKRGAAEKIARALVDIALGHEK